MVIAFPYITIPSELCIFNDWHHISEDGQSLPVSDAIAGWDYNTALEFHRVVELDVETIHSAIGLADVTVDLELVITAETGPSDYRWVVWREQITNNEKWEKNIEITLDSTCLAERVSLHTEILLKSSVKGAGVFTANLAGSRLFRETKQLQLEGSLGRFPMEMLDFGDGLPFLQAPDAMWYLDWDPARPESRFLGTVLLYINSSNEEIAGLVQAADPSILSVLRCDVIRTMCLAMLRSDEFLSDYATYDPDTVGGQVREWLAFVFDGPQPPILRAQLDSAPGRFEARLQSKFI